MGDTIRSLPSALAAAALAIAVACGGPAGEETRSVEEPGDGRAGEERPLPASEPAPELFAARTLYEQEVERSGGGSAAAAEAAGHWLEACLAATHGRHPSCVEAARARLDGEEARTGPEHPDLAPHLLELSEMLAANLRIDEALVPLERALEIRRAHFGPGAEVALSLTWLGNFHLHERRDLEQARHYFQQSLAMRRQHLGLDALVVGHSLHNLAVVLTSQEDYEGALEMAEEAARVVTRSRGADHPDVAQVLGQRSIVKMWLGNYAGALEDLGEAEAIRRQTLGEDHLAVGHSINNRGHVYSHMGDYESALALYREALPIVRRARGEDDLQTAIVIENQAEMHGLLGHDEEARQRYAEALAILERIGQGSSAQAGRLLLEHGQLDLRRGRLADAERRLSRAARLLEDNLGADIPLVAYCLEALGEVALQRDRLEAAVPFLERALAIRRARYGPDHPLVARTMTLQAEERRRSGADREALELALGAEERGRRHLELTVSALGERQALRYAAERASGQDVALALAARGRLPDDVDRIWDAVVRSRALILDEMAKRHRAVHSAPDPEVARLRERLQAARRREARLLIRSLDMGVDESLAEQLARARMAKERAEAELAAVSREFRRELAEGRPGLVEVRRRLDAGAALVAFSRYREPRQQALRYLAFVLRPERPRPQVVDLGPAASIDRQTMAWKRLAGRAPAGPFADPARAEAEYRRAGGALRRSVWDPLAGPLAGVARVFLVPAGTLHLVSFATLPTEDGGYLVEQGPLLHTLSAERDLVRRRAPRESGGSLLALGGPAFDAPPSGDGRQLAAKEPAAQPASLWARFRGVARECPQARDLHFDPLPAAASEAAAIARQWQRSGSDSSAPPEALWLSDGEASEAAIKHLAGDYRVVHLATHAFFLDPACSENRLQLSGLALAAANHRLQAPAAGEDGILTAQEIASLDLARTRWVVLSACETGVGTLQSGEGVLGLRRAFEIAGASTVIMSMWRVGDEAARLWMEALYRHRLAGLETAAALRAASRERLEAARGDGGAATPATWGAFVAVGDWR